MERRKKIELSTVHFDSNQKPRIKSVHYDVADLSSKHIRDWEDKTGAAKSDWIVLFDKPNDKDFILLAMSRNAYLKVMKEIGAIETI